MDNRNSNSADMALENQPESRPTSGWRRYWRFPKSWKEVRSLGWKFVLGFVLFYLIRDSILYILIPWLIYKGIII